MPCFQLLFETRANNFAQLKNCANLIPTSRLMFYVRAVIVRVWGRAFWKTPGSRKSIM